MMLQIKACIFKQLWQVWNNKKKLFLGFLLNLIAIFMAVHNLNLILGDKYNYQTIILLYFVLWLVYNSLMMIGEIVNEIRTSGTASQIFLSSCKISKYTLIQVITRTVVSILFVGILSVCYNIIVKNISFSWLYSFFIIVSIGVFALIGVGYIIESVSMYLRNKTLIFWFKLMMVYLIIKSDDNWYIPFVKCKIMLTALFLNEGEDYCFVKDDLGILCVNALVWFLLGYVVYKYVADKNYLIE